MTEIEDALALCNRNPARMILKYPQNVNLGDGVGVDFLKHTTWIGIDCLVVFWHRVQMTYKASPDSCSALLFSYCDLAPVIQKVDKHYLLDKSLSSDCELLDI